MESEKLSPRTARAHLDSLQADGAAAGVRAGAPVWYVAAQALCVAGNMLSFSLGRWEAMGFVVSIGALVLLGMLRPVITGTRADPWAYRHSVLATLAQAGFVALTLAIGMFTIKPGGSAAVLGAAVLLAFGGSLVLGLRVERSLVRSVTEGAG